MDKKIARNPWRRTNFCRRFFLQGKSKFLMGVSRLGGAVCYGLLSGRCFALAQKFSTLNFAPPSAYLTQNPFLFAYGFPTLKCKNSVAHTSSNQQSCRGKGRISSVIYVHIQKTQKNFLFGNAKKILDFAGIPLEKSRGR